eukprot:5525868-Alexandrium_andersonii.AAC.1
MSAEVEGPAQTMAVALLLLAARHVAGLHVERTRARTSGCVRQSGSYGVPRGPFRCTSSRLALTAWSGAYLARSWRPSTSPTEC